MAFRAAPPFWYGCVNMVGKIGARGLLCAPAGASPCLTPTTRRPKQRIKELEQQLALMSQKAQFLEAVVDVLKNDYGVSIVKKRPGKSSRSGKSRG